MTTGLRFSSAVLLLVAGSGLMVLAGRTGLQAPAPSESRASAPVAPVVGAVHDGDEVVLLARARAALDQGDNDEARRILALLERSAPESPQAHALRSELEGLRAALPVAKAETRPQAYGVERPLRGGAVGRSASDI